MWWTAVTSRIRGRLLFGTSEGPSTGCSRGIRDWPAMRSPLAAAFLPDLPLQRPSSLRPPRRRRRERRASAEGGTGRGIRARQGPPGGSRGPGFPRPQGGRKPRRRGRLLGRVRDRRMPDARGAGEEGAAAARVAALEGCPRGHDRPARIVSARPPVKWSRSRTVGSTACGPSTTARRSSGSSACFREGSTGPRRATTWRWAEAAARSVGDRPAQPRPARNARSRAKALPRWLTRSFCSRGTSPKVFPNGG